MDNERRLETIELRVSKIEEKIADHNMKFMTDITEIKRETSSKISDIERQAAVGLANQTNIDTRLKSIEDSTKWVLRLVIGLIITALIALVVKGGSVV